MITTEALRRRERRQALLTVVFTVLALRGDITGKDFLTIFLMVITFYFGTQSQKAQDAMDAKGDDNGTEN